MFCIQNEKTILSALTQVVCFYNYEIQATQTGAKTTLNLSQTVTLRFFGVACLEIINSMLDNIQKTQLVENEEIYLELLSNFMFKSAQSDIY